MKKIILASGSPRRKQLLEWAEIPFEVVVSDADETIPQELSFPDAAMHVAKLKAEAVNEAHAGKIILAADTIVICNNEMLGKPVDAQDAVRMLSMLSGNTHQVITGVCILLNKKEILFNDITSVEFNPLSQDQIRFYVDKYSPYDKAGAYAIQEWIGVTGIKCIHGDFYNVMGLPVNRVIPLLSSLG